MGGGCDASASFFKGSRFCYFVDMFDSRQFLADFVQDLADFGRSFAEGFAKGFAESSAEGFTESFTRAFAEGFVGGFAEGFAESFAEVFLAVQFRRDAESRPKSIRKSSKMALAGSKIHHKSSK